MAEVVSPSGLLRLVAAEFDRRGWEYDLTIGQTILDDIERVGYADPPSIAQRLPGSFYRRQGTTREVLESVIARTIGHFRLESRDASSQVTVVTDNRSYKVSITGSASDTNINLGDGRQANVTISADKSEILLAVETLIVGALSDGLDADLARELANTIQLRDDVTAADVHEVALAAVVAKLPKRHAAIQLARDIVAAGLGGALGTGIASAIAEVIGSLPG